jgi:uroporphyrinogen decarboxylase
MLDKPNGDRLLAAYQHKKHDRVPNFEVSIDPLILGNLMGWPQKLPRSDSLAPDKAMELARFAHMDAILFNNQYWIAELASNHEELLEQFLPPEPEKRRDRLKTYIDAVAGTNIGVVMMISGCFFTTYCCMGPTLMQSFMYNIYDDPEFVFEMMDRQLEGQIAIVEACRGLPVLAVELADDLCGNQGFLVMEDWMRDHYWPRLDKLIAAVRTLNCPIQFHCCGNVTPVLPYFLQRKIDAITPMQANCNDIYSIRKAVGNEITLMGNMSIEGVLAFGTPDEVREDTKAHIDGVGRDGSYIVASSHSIVNTIPKENYLAMIDTALHYGVF